MHLTVRFLKDEAGWAVWIGAALIAFWLSTGTAYHQPLVGLLLAAVSLFVALTLFEALWRTIDNRPPK